MKIYKALSEVITQKSHTKKYKSVDTAKGKTWSTRRAFPCFPKVQSFERTGGNDFSRANWAVIAAVEKNASVATIELLAMKWGKNGYTSYRNGLPWRETRKTANHMTDNSNQMRICQNDISCADPEVQPLDSCRSQTERMGYCQRKNK